MSWQKNFVGREAERNLLLDAWEKAKQGDPQNILLIADTGWGKTRLMQQLYETLATDQADNDYWPIEIDPSGDLRRQTVNPSFDSHSSRSPIPYLWLGMKGESNRVAIIEAMEHMREHTLSLLKLWRQRLELKSLDRGALQSLLDLLVEGSASMLGLDFPTAVVESAAKAFKRLRRRRELLQARVPASTQETSLQAKQEWIAELADLFEAFLSSKDEKLPTVPVLLFLDDAQAADPATLALCEQLINRARANRWPLMLVASHWKKDLPPEYVSERRSSNDWPHRLADMLDANGSPLYWSRIELGPEPRLIDIVIAAHPYMPRDQQEQIAKLSSGHPLRLHTLLKLIALNPTWLEEGQLTEHALGKLRSADSMNALAQEIFACLEAELRTLLGWASRNGMRFLHRIVAEMAANPNFRPVFDYDRFESDIDKASRESGFTERAASLPVSTFTQADFHAIALRFFGDSDPRHQEAAVLAMRSALEKALGSEEFDLLSSVEQEDALDLALVEFRPSGQVRVEAPEWQRWAQFGFEKLRLLEESFRTVEAEALALDLGSGESWPIHAAPFWNQYLAIVRLIDHQELERAVQWSVGLSSQDLAQRDRMALAGILGDAYAAQSNWDDAMGAYLSGKALAEQEAQRSEREHAPLRDLAVFLERFGDVAAARQQWTEAFTAYNESKTIREEIVQRFGREYQALRDLSVSLGRIGDACAANQDWGAALSAYQSSQSIVDEIIQDIGPRREPLRDLTVSWIKVGNVFAAQQNWAEALTNYQAAMTVREGMVQRFGRGYEPLRDLSVSWNKLGDVYAAQQKWSDALNACQSAKTIADEIVLRFGRAYEPLRDLSVSLTKLGDVLAALQRWSDALTAYQEAKDICDEIVGRFGREYSPLRGALVAWHKLCAIYASQQNWREAFSAYLSAKTIADEIVLRFGREYEPLRDLSGTLQKLGDAYVAEQDWTKAIEAYSEAKTIRDEMVQRFGGEYQPLRDLAVSWERLGDVYAAIEEWDEAAVAYDAGKSIRDDIVLRFGDAYEASRDLSVSWERLGYVYSSKQQWKEALNALEVCKSIREDLVKRFEKEYEPLRNLSVSWNNLGDTYVSLQRWTEALDAYLAGKAIRDELVQLYGGEYQPLRDLSVSLHKIAVVRASIGDFEKACAVLRESEAINNELMERFPGSSEARSFKAILDGALTALGCGESQ